MHIGLYIVSIVGFALWTLYAVYLAGKKEPASQWEVAILSGILALSAVADLARHLATGAP